MPALYWGKPGKVWVCGTERPTVAVGQAGRGPSESHGPCCQPAQVWSRDGHPSSQPSGDTPGHCPHPARVWTQRPQISPCIPQLHWPVRMQQWDISMAGPAGKCLPMPSGNGLAPSGNGLVPAARGHEGPHRLLPACLLPALAPSRVPASFLRHRSQRVLTWLQK